MDSIVDTRQFHLTAVDDICVFLRSLLKYKYMYHNEEQQWSVFFYTRQLFLAT